MEGGWDGPGKKRGGVGVEQYVGGQVVGGEWNSLKLWPSYRSISKILSAVAVLQFRFRTVLMSWLMYRFKRHRLLLPWTLIQEHKIVGALFRTVSIIVDLPWRQKATPGLPPVTFSKVVWLSAMRAMTPLYTWPLTPWNMFDIHVNERLKQGRDRRQRHQG